MNGIAMSTQNISFTALRLNPIKKSLLLIPVLPIAPNRKATSSSSTARSLKNGKEKRMLSTVYSKQHRSRSERDDASDKEIRDNISKR